MIRRLSLLFATFALAACALPFGTPPAPAAPVPTAAPTSRPPTQERADPTAATRPTVDQPQPTVGTGSTSEPLPTTEIQPTTSPATSGDIDDPARIAAAQPGERDQIALAKAFRNIGEIPTVARTTPLEVKLGDVEQFWVADQANNTNYQISAELRYIGPVALMYVDTSVEVDQADIERSAKEFEQRIYQRNRELFGEELSPGVDGDPRLTILNTPLTGAGGYFSSADAVVKAVNRFSNEREMFVVGINSYPLGSESYASTLAHEFQHMIEWNVARRSPTWFNEGMSMLAQDLNGYVEHNSASLYLGDTDLQLTYSDQSGPYYGAWQLFLRYFQEQYAGEEGLRELIKADAGNNPDVFVSIAQRKRPDIKSFADIYADWAVANVINEPSVDDGRYAYKLLPGGAALQQIQSGNPSTTVRQFGTDAYGVLEGPLSVTFDGEDTVRFVGAQPKEGRYMWWSNRGDDSYQTLTREFDLSGVSKATLQFSTWYEIEKDYDYAFVAVSTDNGQHWTTLPGNTTTNDDPQGHNFGNGLTGVSGSPEAEPDKGTRGKWIEEQMDLTPFAGKQVLLRFWVVHDDAYNTSGLLIDNIRIPELNYSDGGEAGDSDWQAQGFVRTTGTLSQTWALRLIRVKDRKISVEPVPLDEQSRATVELTEGEIGALVVIGTTPFTTEPAEYTYSLAP